MMLDRVGQQLGNYRLLRFLGKGGFAQVYLAEHIFLKRPAAVKVLHQQVTEDALLAFHREARVIARLEHPYIVRVLEFGIEQNVPFMVMSYAPNGTLRQRHSEGSRVPLSTIVGYLRQIAPALQYAHAQRVVHRDVKPQNMLIGLSDEILLSDFGIAVVSESTSQRTQNQAGTTAYMAPEQYQGKLCFASDQYALGIVVYEWLCGERPFKGNALELAMQHQFAAPPPLRGYVPQISPALEQVVFKVLTKDPQQRFPTVQDFAQAFEQAYQSPSFLRTPHAPFPSPMQAPPAPYPPILQPQQLGAFPPQSIPPPKYMLPSPAPALNMQRGRRGASALKIVPLGIGLALLLIIGSILLNLLNSTVANHNAGVQASNTAQALALASEHASATAAAPAFASGTSKGVMFAFNAQRTNFNPYEKMLTPANVSSLVQNWTTPVGSYTEATPAVINGVLYVGSNDFKVYAINAISGKTIWTATTGNYISSSPAVADGIVYVSSRDYKLYAFRASSGKLLWTATTHNTIESSPAVANGIVYVGSDKLYAFSAISGRLLWTASASDYIACSPTVANGIVYVDADKLYAFSAISGRLLWTAPIGKIRWSSVTGDVTFSPAVANGVVYIGTDKLYALNAVTGKVLWSASASDYISSSPAVANGVVYIGANDGKLYAFSTSSGKMLWSIVITGGLTDSSPAVANGVIYLGDNTLAAFDATSGKLLWTDSDVSNFITSSAMVANGIVYVSARDHICAFHLPA